MGIAQRSLVNYQRADRFAAALLTVGAGLALGALAMRPRPRTNAPERNLASYLMDHLMGSDAALTIVTRLALSREGTPEGVLFGTLKREFEGERNIVRSVLKQMGSPSVSVKRAAGYASGAVLQAVAGGDDGSLALFRTLESLLIGVQGKRCLWRALQALELELEESSNFSTLEGQALGQWERIEALRQSQLVRTFGQG